jgi:biotin carboxylase
MHSVLHLGAGPLMRRTILRLKENGYRVFAVDRNPQAPALGVADGSAPVDVADAAGVAAYARQIGAEVLLPVNDLGVVTAARVSRELGLPGLAEDVAWRCVHKGQMRACWKAAGLPQPDFRAGPTLENFAEAARALGFPVLVKPAFGWGSRGVSLASSEGELPWSIDFARQALPAGSSDLVVESFVAGTEMTIEGLVQHGEAHVLAWSDKEAQEHTRFRVAMALNYPARFATWQLDLARDTVKRAVQALGLENGAFHCECMVNNDGVWLIELAARGGGGHIFGQIVEAVSGVCMPDALVKIILGKPVPLKEGPQQGACYRFFTPPAGFFERVEGIEEARQTRGVLDLGFSMLPGTRVTPVETDAARPGYAVTTGATREEAMANADRAIAALHFVMRPISSRRVPA